MCDVEDLEEGCGGSTGEGVGCRGRAWDAAGGAGEPEEFAQVLLGSMTFVY